MYIVPNVYPTILYCDRDIGPTPRYRKWSLICYFIFVCRVIIDHEFISDVMAVVNSFYFFAGIIFINFRLL